MLDVSLIINENGVLESAEFDDTADLDIDTGFEEIVDYIHKTQVHIPSGVTRIGELAFNDKRWLLGVSIPGTVTSIGDNAFSDCYYMESITIPDSVEDIGNRTFAYCEALRNVILLGETTSIANDAFFGCGKELTIRAKKGSFAERYAAENAIRFESL